jgi:hypothetical protein
VEAAHKVSVKSGSMKPLMEKRIDDWLIWLESSPEIDESTYTRIPGEAVMSIPYQEERHLVVAAGCKARDCYPGNWGVRGEHKGRDWSFSMRSTITPEQPSIETPKMAAEAEARINHCVRQLYMLKQPSI